VELIGEIMKIRKRIGVGSCGGVKVAIITTWPPTTIFFRHHVKRRGPGTIGAANDSLFFQLKELLLGNSVLFRIEAAGMGGDGACICFYCVENTMSRFVRMQVCAKESRKGVKELLDRRGNVGQGCCSGGDMGVSGGGDDLKGRAVKELVM
jgi:hypothetical protein